MRAMEDTSLYAERHSSKAFACATDPHLALRWQHTCITWPVLSFHAATGVPHKGCRVPHVACATLKQGDRAGEGQCFGL